MAGSVFRGLGWISIALGGILLVGGGATVFMGFSDEQENNQGLLGGSSSRSDTNEELMGFGVGLAVMGFALLLLGIVFVTVGGARRERSLRHALEQATK